MEEIKKKKFTKGLLKWHSTCDRPMPWKGERNPYLIWLSEIILQQTRVEQGLPYFEKFKANYPTIIDLANARDDDVFKDWEGLGYYNRCRNMLYTARYIRDEFQGVFPREFDQILSLKGVGMYTACAIASFAYDLPFAVVDGNVIRVLSRYLTLDKEFVKQQDKNEYQAIAQRFLTKRKPAAYNQAIMDLGATVCTPQNPQCNICPVQKKCQANKTNTIDKYPPKKKKIALRKRTFHYIILHNKRSIYIRKREEKDIWFNLHEPILIEQKNRPSWLMSTKAVSRKIQKLSHQQLDIRFYILNSFTEIPIDIDSYTKVSINSLRNKAFPISVYEFLKEFDYI